MQLVKKYMDNLVWLIGIVGAITTCFGYREYYVKYIYEVNVILIIIIISLLIYSSRSKKTDIKEVDTEELIKEVIGHSEKYKNIVIYNPDKSFEWFGRLNRGLINNDTDISYVGDSEDFMSILGDIYDSSNKNKVEKFITNISYKHMFIILSDMDKKNIIIACIVNNQPYIVKLKDRVLINIVNKYINRKTLKSYDIDLDSFENPSTILKIINEKKDTYIKSFNELRNGSITFFGSEVLQVQSGWIETGSYKEINTLDLTTNPGIFKNRTRYNNTNKKYLDNDGIIKRVYIIEEERLEDTSFYNDLYDAIKFQKEIGVIIGLQFMNSLPEAYIQDFILYDDNIVLVENKQADSHYSKASSTAFFNKDRIVDYRYKFNEVWDGKYSVKKPTEIAKEYLRAYEENNRK